MATDGRPELEENITKLVHTGSQELAPVAISEPVVPRRLTDEESQEIHGRAESLVKQLEEASGSQELDLVDGMTSLGIQAQRTAGGELDLVRRRVGEMVTSEGPGAELWWNCEWP